MRAKATCTLHSMHLCSFAGPEIRDQSTGTVWKVLQNQTNRRWFLSYWSRWICFFHWHILAWTPMNHLEIVHGCPTYWLSVRMCAVNIPADSCRLYGVHNIKGVDVFFFDNSNHQQLATSQCGFRVKQGKILAGRWFPLPSLTIPYQRITHPSLFPFCSHRNLRQVQTQRVLIHETWRFFHPHRNLMSAPTNLQHGKSDHRPLPKRALNQHL